MAKKFKRQQLKTVRTTYNYKPRNPLKDEERAIYRRIALTFVIIIISAGVLYVWGTDILYGITNFWRELVPGADIEITTENDSNGPIIAPQIDPLIEFTNENTIEIAGWAQSGNEVKIVNNDQEVVTVLADKNGRFAYTSTLQDGENVIKAIVLSNSTESDPSATQTVTLDTIKPELSVTFGEISEDGVLVISGTTELGAVVYVNERRAIVNQEGTFSYDLKLETGENVVTVTSEDKAGNIETVQDARSYSPPEDVSE